MSKHKGEPAFPIVIDLGNNVEWHKGMTMRDYIATKAMQSILCSDIYRSSSFEEISQCAYEVADEMIKQGAKQ
jgi:hypothetical protein